MSNSPLVSYTLISPNSTNPRNHKIDTITIHHIAGVLTAKEIANLTNFRNPEYESSCNYAVGKDGDIALIVEEKNRSWCSSSRSNDHRAITIEVSNSARGGNWPVSDKVIEATIELCVDICKRNNIEKLNFTGDKTGNLTMHKWFANTNCPGPYLESKYPYIAEEVNRRLGIDDSTPQPDSPSPPKGHSMIQNGSSGPDVVELQTKLNFIGYDCGSADGIFGKNTENAVRAFQGNNNLDPDGICGPATWTMVDAVYAVANNYTLQDFVREVQSICGASVDGIAGPETLSKTITVSRAINFNHAIVKPLQKRLYALGYSVVGEADGIAGSKFDTAVRKYQANHTSIVDGEITGRGATWKSVLGL